MKYDKLFILCIVFKIYQKQYIITWMDIIFINTENSKANKSNRFRLYFTNKLDLRGNKAISLANFSIYYM